MSREQISGIGRAIVDAFLHHGVAKVYAAVRNLDSAAPLIERYGDRVVPVHLDLAKPETITAMADKANDVQVVVNNAAIFKLVTPLDAMPSMRLSLGWRSMYSVLSEWRKPLLPFSSKMAAGRSSSSTRLHH